MSEPQTIYLKDYQVPLYLIDEIELHFTLEQDFTIVKSNLQVRRNQACLSKGKNLILNGEELTLLSIQLDGQPLLPPHYEVTNDLLIIHDAPQNFSLQITTKIYPQDNTALSGLYRSAKTYCTQCEAEGFRRITYFIDQPDILSRYTTTIVADKATYPFLLSNGNFAGSGELENGKHWVKWVDPFKKPSYLFALVAGDFDVIEDQFKTLSNRNIILRIFVEKGYGDQAQHAMYSLKEAMLWDEKTYGREYDLDVYMIVAIGDFNMGAMENKGLNIFNTKYVLAKPETATDDDYIHIMSVIGHEYFHNWSGNRVTCRDWFQLSLKEGLTIFRDQSFTEDMLSHAVMRIRDVNVLREQQFPEDAGPLAHQVRPDAYIEINNFYTSTIYNKGAEVLRMLQTILGKALFRKGMDLYFSRHDGQAVTIEDYVKTMEEVSEMDLSQFRLWYSQAGTPLVNVSDDYDPQKKIYTLTMTQSCASTRDQAEKKPFYIPIKMGLLDETGNALIEEQVLILNTPSQVFQFKNINSKPIPSLLRNFSAPIKLNYPYSESDLQFLFKYDKDPFNRWEAGQNYAVKILLKLVQDYQQNNALQLPCKFVEMYEHILQQDAEDNFMLAEMLYLPSEKYLGEQMDVVDVDAIHAAREFALAEMAKQLEALLLATYYKYHNDTHTYHFSMDDVGKRQLKNRCLFYLMLLPKHASLGMKQYEASLKVNMTDAQAALASLTNLNSPLRQEALNQFYVAWKHDALVVDKWLGLQAASKLPNALSNVKTLMRHEAFDLKNPNKVHALLGTFANRNLVNFHAKSGEGYAFLRETVQQLDKLNPQGAARLVKALTSWERYDKERQALMRGQLESLLQDKKISKDVFELVIKSLEASH